MEIVTGALRMAVGGLFLLSSCGKAASPASTHRMLSDLGVWRPRLAGAILIGAEGAAAVVVFFPSFGTIAAVLVVALGASFALGAVVASRKQAAIICACFGGSGSPLGAKHVVRGAAICAAGVALLLLPYRWRAEVGWTALDLTICGAVVLMTVRVVRVMRAAAADRVALSDSTYNAVSA